MRGLFADELEDLRLQVELMALRAGDALALSRRVIEHGDAEAAQQLFASDDEIDAMHVSLTERCYELLVLHQPVASDMRLVVSVIRVLGALERVGNLCLRIAKTVDDHPVLAAHPAVFRVILDLADNVQERFDVTQRAWSQNDLSPLAALDRAEPLEMFADPLVARIQELDGPDAVRAAMAAFVVGRSLDRIGDHTSVMGVRLRYLVTGDSAYLAEEVGT